MEVSTPQIPTPPSPGVAPRDIVVLIPGLLVYIHTQYVYPEFPLCGGGLTMTYCRGRARHAFLGAFSTPESYPGSTTTSDAILGPRSWRGCRTFRQWKRSIFRSRTFTDTDEQVSIRQAIWRNATRHSKSTSLF